VERKFTFPIGLTDGEQIEIKGIGFHGVPSAHDTVERDELGRCRFMGYVASFGKWKVYHSGDTLWYDNMVDILKPFRVDVALLPINGNVPARRVAGNLSAEEAARLGKAIGARLVIPHHYDMFAFNTADPRDFASAAKKNQQAFSILKPGERWNSSSIQLQIKN
jgi:L-ascorbate metabolism protein UlaG (beta-lactamase superfamily)